MPTLNIKDPEVYRLAAELAKKRQISMTAAVRDALQDALSRRDTEIQARIDRIMEISRRAAAIDAPFLTDDDLYDEMGLPK